MKKNIYIYKNEYGEIWQSGKSLYILVKVPPLNRRFASWKDSDTTAIYYYPDGRVLKQFDVPLNKQKITIKVLKEAEQSIKTSAA